MSFQDLRQSGTRVEQFRREPTSSSAGPRANGTHASAAASSSTGSPWATPSSGASTSHAVAAGVFQMNTAVNTFNRLVNTLGTSKDTPELRERLHKSRQYIAQLAKDTSAKLKDATADDHAADVSASKKISDAKLARDFQSILREFEKAQRTANEREASFQPTSAASGIGQRGLGPGRASANEQPPSPVELKEQSRPLLADGQRQEMMVVERELVYNEAVIEEREAGIQEIQQQIAEVNEIFQDLAVLVKEQGVMIDDIEANIEGTRAQTVQATKQLKKAAHSQKESNSFTCWVMAVFAIGLFIFFLIMSS